MTQDTIRISIIIVSPPATEETVIIIVFLPTPSLILILSTVPSSEMENNSR